MPYKTSKIKHDRLSRRGRLGVLKRREKMIAMGRESIEVANITFSGSMFKNETHTLRCLLHEDETHLMIEIDGLLYKPRTLRGLKKIISERIWK